MKDFSKASEVIKIIKENLVDYETVAILGGGFLGLECAVVDLEKSIVYEWSDECLHYYEKRGIECKKCDIAQTERIFEADVILLFDTLEHLQKIDGEDLLRRCEGQVAIFMPVQPNFRRPLRDLMVTYAQQKNNQEQLTQHLSLWTKKDLEDVGFKVWYSEKYHKKNHGNWDAMIAIRNSE